MTRIRSVTMMSTQTYSDLARMNRKKIVIIIKGSRKFGALV